jgi:hypothetical protein
VVTVVEDDDRLPLGVRTRDLDGVLDRLGTAVEQGRLLGVVARGQLGQRLGDGDVALVRRHHEAGVGEVGELRGRLAHHGLGGGADGGHGDAGTEVDQTVAVHVLDDAAAGARHEDRERGAHTLRDHGRAAGLQLLRLRAGDGGDDAALLLKCGHGGSWVLRDLWDLTDAWLLFSQARTGTGERACSMWALSAVPVVRGGQVMDTATCGHVGAGPAA